MASSLGATIHRTTAYHPQANGLCERFHRSLKAALRASLTDTNWVNKLPWVLLGLRAAPKEDLDASPAELVFAQPLRLPGEFLPENPEPGHLPAPRFLGSNGPDSLPGPAHHSFPRVFVPQALKNAEFVFVRHEALKPTFRPPYDGPFRVLEPGDKHFVLDFGDRKETVSIDRLKPAFLLRDEPARLARAPRRGRPPKRKDSAPLQGTNNHSPPQAADSLQEGPTRTPKRTHSRFGRRLKPRRHRD